jgi:exonuclease VII large subunit
VSLPDADITVINQDGEGIKIATVRQVITDSSFRPYARAERAVLILNLEQASLPAQQALLKFFEEPPDYLRILATTSSMNAILPTIQSRCQLIQQNITSAKTTDAVSAWVKNLEQASYSDITEISNVYKEKAEAISFLNQCVESLTQSASYPNKFAVTASQILLTSIDHLQHNANTRLTIEDCFFSIKNRF